MTRELIYRTLIEEFIYDLKCIKCWTNDYGDELADGRQLGNLISKYEQKVYGEKWEGSPK